MSRNAEVLKIRPWAVSSTANRQDPESAGLTRTTGWGANYSLAGGRLPERRVFNQLLCELSSLADDVQRRGVLEWDASVRYSEQAVVLHRARLWITSHATTGAEPGSDGSPWDWF